MKQIALKWIYDSPDDATLHESGSDDYVASVCGCSWYVHDDPEFSNGMTPEARWGESGSFAEAQIAASREVARQLIDQFAKRGQLVTVELRYNRKRLEVVK